MKVGGQPRGRPRTARSDAPRGTRPDRSSALATARAKFSPPHVFTPSTLQGTKAGNFRVNAFAPFGRRPGAAMAVDCLRNRGYLERDAHWLSAAAIGVGGFRPSRLSLRADNNFCRTTSMPLNYSRKLTGRTRSKGADRQLGFVLAFVAGAINAGGFLAVQQYTSHMTGIVSAIADRMALGAYHLVLPGIGALASFIIGAACAAVMVNYSRRHKLHSEYAFPLLVEAGLLLCFGLLGTRLAVSNGLFVSVTVMLLSFIMGLQNALITKISNAEIRTTHITGIVTDIGIELGKLFYWNGSHPDHLPKVKADRPRLRMLAFLAFFFFIGGVIGAVGFKHVGYVATVPLALTLMALVIVPVADDLNDFIQNRKN